MIKKNEIIEVLISDISFEGLGIAKTDVDGRDFVIFIHNAVVGDRIMCRIVKTEKTYAYGIIETLISPSDKRTEPQCPTFEKCGGCVMLNMKYEAELEAKRNFVVSAMRRYGAEVENVEETEPSPVTEHYRNKVILPLSPNGKFGFYARASHRNIENNCCLLQDIAFEKIIIAAEKFISMNKIPAYDEQSGKGLFRQLYMRSAQSGGEICVTAVINGKKLPNENIFAEEMIKNGATCVYINENTTRGNTLLGRDFRLIGGKEKITDTLCGLKFEISPKAFYQINRRQTENLYNYALSLAEITENDTVLDLFCGIGTITLNAAKLGAKKVIGVEIVEEAIEDAKRNAEINGIKNAEFYAADAAKTLEIIKKSGNKPDIITVDPPRKGLSDEAINAVITLNPKKVVYVSCNPETLARDIAIFKKHGYIPNNPKPFDMFPRTQHVETVVLLIKI